MKNTRPYQQLILFLFLMLTSVSYAAEGGKQCLTTNLLEMDSLKLHNTKTTAYYIIQKNKKIKVWSNGKTYKGQFIAIQNGRLSMQTRLGIVYLPVKTITKIKDLGDSMRVLLGASIMGGGIYATGVSAVLLGGSIWTLIEDGNLYIIYTVPLVAISLGIVKLGDWLRGPEFKMKKNWTIVQG